MYSVRVSLNYRVLGLVESDHIYWYRIGVLAGYDELLKWKTTERFVKSKTMSSSKVVILTEEPWILRK